MSFPSGKNPLLGPTQEDRLWAGLSYVGGVCFFFGIPSILIFFLKRGESAYIRYHALQAAVFSIVWLILMIVVLYLSYLTRLPFLVLFMLLAPCFVWILLIVQTFMGKNPKIPFVSHYISRYTAD